MQLISGHRLNSNGVVYEAAIEWSAWMLEKRWISKNTIGAFDSFLAFTENDRVVSFLVYNGLSKVVNIYGAWTHPDYLRQGLYTRLFEELVKILKSKGVRRIRSGFHKENIASKKMQLKQGRRIVGGPSKFGCYSTEFIIGELDG